MKKKNKKHKIFMIFPLKSKLNLKSRDHIRGDIYENEKSFTLCYFVISFNIIVHYSLLHMVSSA
jgi:hypothetical protein